MLTEIRDRSSGWLAWAIAAMIIIPMAFWGVQDYASTEATPTLIEVGDQKITENQFQARLASEQQRQRQAMGDQVNNSLLNSDFFKKNVLDQMIGRALIDQVAEEHDYRIGNQQLSDLIKKNPVFQAEGKFDSTAYERYVQSSQYSKTQFENAIRDDNRVGQVLSGYQESALVLPDEVRQLLEMQAEQRSFDLLKVQQQDYVSDVTVSDDEISDYYSANEQTFLETEKVSLNYLELDMNQVLQSIDVNEDELLAVYEQNVDSYISAETRETRHILLSVDGENDASQLAKAESLVAELRAGADFAELAKNNSEDPGSAVNGGDLGVVERGMMVEEFETATYALTENEISEPIKSQFGYHIIQVSKINESAQQSFEEVRFDIEQDEKERLAEEKLLDDVERLRDFAFEQPDNLDSAAEELSLQIQSTELFDQDSGDGIAANAEVRSAAFSDAVLYEDTNSEPIEVSSGRYVVVRKRQHQPSKPKQLASVSEEIKQILTDEKASEAASEAGQQLLQQAQSDWQAFLAANAAESEQLKVESYTVALTDQQRNVDATVLAEVATMRLENDSPQITSVTTNNGDYYIVRLNKIEAGDVNAVSEQIKDSTRRLIEQRNGQSLATAYLESLRAEVVSEIDSSLL